MDAEQQSQRIAELLQSIDAMLAANPISSGMDINEMLGAHDGALMAIREAWDELKELLIRSAGPTPDHLK